MYFQQHRGISLHILFPRFFCAREGCFSNVHWINHLAVLTFYRSNAKSLSFLKHRGMPLTFSSAEPERSVAYESRFARSTSKMSASFCSLMQLCPLFRPSFFPSTFVVIHIAGSSFIFNIFMESDLSKVTSATSLGTFPLFSSRGSFLFCFHQHRGKVHASTCVFINIVESPKSDICSRNYALDKPIYSWYDALVLR